MLSRPEVVNYLNDLLDDEAFNERLGQGLEQAYSGWAAPARPKARILVCNGKHCSKGNRNYPVIHYLLNRLAEAERTRDVDVKVVQCLHSCDNGPAFYLDTEKELFPMVTLNTVDHIVERLEGGCSESAFDCTDKT